jgi:hypothetical protein
MGRRLAKTLDAIAQEREAPIYALERLRAAVAEDERVEADQARRLKALDRSGEGRAFGSGWGDFFALAVRASARS